MERIIEFFLCPTCGDEVYEPDYECKSCEGGDYQ